MKSGNVLPAIACIALPLFVGGLSGLLAGNESRSEWYLGLEKPSFNPPSWVFGPVWTTLYLLMGMGLYLIASSPQSVERRRALMIFGVQLILNFFWSLIFFRWHQLGLAAAEILVLLVAIVLMIITFRKVRPLAAYLQVPYLCWVSFATVLTLSIFWLNRGS